MAKTSAASIAGQMLQPARVASNPATSPVVPVITPVDRSVSPPMMSSATAVAMMPSVDAGSRMRATPVTDTQFAGAMRANISQTARAPIRAPISTRRNSARTGLTRASRSSAWAFAVPARVVISAPPAVRNAP